MQIDKIDMDIIIRKKKQSGSYDNQLITETVNHLGCLGYEPQILAIQRKQEVFF